MRASALFLLASLAAPAALAEEPRASGEDPPATAAPAPGEAEAPEPSLSYGVETDVMAFYLWRGIPLSEPGVNQPYGWVEYKNLELGVYANQTFNPNEETVGGVNEVGLLAIYPFEAGPLAIEPSIQAYFYPAFVGDSPTAEAFFKVAYPAGDFAPYLMPVVDFVANIGGSYLEAGVDYEIEPWADATLRATLSLGAGSGKFNEFNIEDEEVGDELDEATLNFAGAAVYLETPLGGPFYLRPHAEFAAILDADVALELGRRFIPNLGLAFGLSL